MKFLKERKAQGAFEYILLLAGVLLIVVLAIIILRSSVLGSANTSINEGTGAAQRAASICSAAGVATHNAFYPGTAGDACCLVDASFTAGEAQACANGGDCDDTTAGSQALSTCTGTANICDCEQVTVAV